MHTTRDTYTNLVINHNGDMSDGEAIVSFNPDDPDGINNYEWAVPGKFLMNGIHPDPNKRCAEYLADRKLALDATIPITVRVPHWVIARVVAIGTIVKVDRLIEEMRF